jgi:hypothetical protein
VVVGVVAGRSTFCPTCLFGWSVRLVPKKSIPATNAATTTMIGRENNECPMILVPHGTETGTAHESLAPGRPHVDKSRNGRSVQTTQHRSAFAPRCAWQGQTLVRRYEMERDGDKWLLFAPLPANPNLGLKVHLERERR